MHLHRTTSLILVAALLPLGMGCSSMTRTQRGAVIGAGAGAAVGAGVGRATGSTARGAIIGAAVGGTAGAIIGTQMDRQARELAARIPGATVQRIGEGLLVTFDSGLLFAFDSDAILPAAGANLTNLANSLREYPDTEVLIVGHTDWIGTAEYNQALSERRARSARDYLVRQGVPLARVRTEGRGEFEPIASNETEAGRQQNRRVEIAIFASEEYRQRLLRSSGA
jgi:outer membrane protein OmpA-like peptidoglycan-associated protein